MTSTSSLDGKRDVVTGGSRGIDAAIVRRPASEGAAVAVLKQDGHLGETYELGGTTFTLTALAATISDVLGAHIAYQVLLAWFQLLWSRFSVPAVSRCQPGGACSASGHWTTGKVGIGEVLGRAGARQ